MEGPFILSMNSKGGGEEREGETGVGKKRESVVASGSTVFIIRGKKGTAGI